MPPKKRKATESAPTSRANKRLTHSSTRSDAPVSQSAASSKVVKVAAKRAQSPPEGKATAKEDKKPPPPRPSKSRRVNKPSSRPSADTSPTAAFETLSINSDLIQSPVQCHSYRSSSKAQPLIFTHAAAGTLSAPAVVNFCTGFSSALPVLAFQGSVNLTSRVKGFHACIEHLGSTTPKLLLGGRSMGARAAVMAASEVLEREAGKEVALVLVSYPLRGPNDVRDQILLDLSASVCVLFVVGDRDAMCPLELLDGVRRRMRAKNQLVVVKSAEHSMKTKPASLEKEFGEQTGMIAAAWVSGDVQDQVMYMGEEA